MRILVTGGLGFVGIHLVRWLAERIPSAFVVAADVQPLKPETEAFFEPVRKNIIVTNLDVRERNAFRQLVKDHGIQAIIHAAAITPDDQQERERMDWVMDVNLGGAMNALIIAAKEPSVNQLLLVSSNGVYGKVPPGSPPMDEESPQELEILYTITKHSAELLTKRASQLSGKRMAAVRLSAIYGELERVAESRNRTSHINRLYQALIEKRQVKVYGQAVSRDWLYAGDCADAIRLLLLAPKWNHPVYNLGSGKPLSFEEMVTVFTDHGLHAEWVDDPSNADISMTTSQARAVLDLNRLKQDTGFSIPMDPIHRLDGFITNNINYL